MKSLVIQRFANNEFRLGFQCLPVRPKKKADGSAVRTAEREAQIINTSLVDVITTHHGCVVLDGSNGNYTLSHEDGEVLRQRRDRALDIISEVQRARKSQNDTQYKPGWGHPCKATTFGAYARHSILEAGTLASKRHCRDGKGVEVTLTLPGGTRDAMDTLSRWSGYAINRLLQVVRRWSPDVMWFYVWELQTRGALHIHMALSGLQQIELLSLGNAIRDKWFDVLEDISRKSGIDLWLRQGGRGRNDRRDALKANRVAEVSKGLSNYFAKYCSKQATKSVGFGKRAPSPPARWWGMCRRLSQEIKKERLNVRITGISETEIAGMLSAIDNLFRGHSPVVSYRYDFELSFSTGGVSVHQGYGWRQISYYSDLDFDKLSVWLPQTLNYLVRECSDAVIEGDIAWLLHTTVEYRSMQRSMQPCSMSA